MKIQINDRMTWTDETPTSRYGLGCIQIQGQDYGPADKYPGDNWDRTVGMHVIISYLLKLDPRACDGEWTPPTVAEINTINKWLSQDPDAGYIRAEILGL